MAWGLDGGKASHGKPSTPEPDRLVAALRVASNASSSSSTLTPSAWARGRTFLVEGADRPDSHPETWVASASILTASACWVRPAARRRSLRVGGMIILRLPLAC
jgi:hypothetical protein